MQKFLKKAAEAYYAGKPIISNEEYDALERTYGAIESVGAKDGDIPHVHRMYSLQKHYDRDGDYPLPPNKCIRTPKLDGAAIAIYYDTANATGTPELSFSLTRGDGITGKLITNHIKHIVPNKLVNRPNKDTVIQVTGELVCKSSTTNARNYCSGALGLNSEEEFLQRVAEGSIVFVAYSAEGIHTETYPQLLEYLDLCGFHTVDNFDYTEYPTDGIVYRLQYQKEYKQLGFTSKHPRGAFAHKDDDDIYETTLLDVSWETGRSGKITPTAILEPIMIDGARVSRATLNNLNYIEALGVTIGCKVQVVRAGKIIPKIVGVVKD